jgi:hypothetical protein
VRGVRSGPGAVAFPGMEVRIGTTVDGRPAGFDTSSTRVLLLVGDVGRGKTTIVRYLTRWWLANTVRHAHVFAQAPSEWADLRCDRQHPDSIEQPVGRGCRPGTCLVVVDGLDLTGDDRLALLPLGSARTVLTSHGGNSLAGRPLFDSDLTCLGLVRPEPADPAEAAVLDGQGRLDWPMGTVAVVPDQRGQMDFPCHRWHTPAGDWAVAR